MRPTPPALCLIAILLAGLTSPQARAQPAAPTEPVSASPRTDADAPAEPLEPPSLLRAQVLLDRAHFSSGEIDGRAGSNLRKAIAGFQRDRGLQDDGRLGPDTWLALERDAVPTLVDYSLLAADLEGPFLELPKDLIERSKLPALGFTSLSEALGERFHASPKLIRTLNPGIDESVVGSVIRVPNVVDAPPPPAAAQIVVDRSDGALMLVDDAGRVVAQFPASTGSTRDPLPIGEWKIDSVAIDPVFYYNPELFWDADPSHGKAQLPPGPNNPVGRAWIDLSKPHYGIHGTPEPSRVGKTESHGCIRLTNWSALLLAGLVKPGMPVLLRE